MVFQTAQQTKNFVNKQATVIRLLKDDLRSADRNQQSQTEFEKFKKMLPSFGDKRGDFIHRWLAFYRVTT